MNSNPTPDAGDPPANGDTADDRYTIEVIAELTGIDHETVLHYQEEGLIRPVSSESPDTAVFDAECLRQLRRIQYLRATCEVNDAGLKLIIGLLHEVETLRRERRQALR